MAFLMDLLILFVLAPALCVMCIFWLLAELARFFGFWIVPGTLGLYFGIMLPIAGSSDPSVPFHSIPQMFASMTIEGLPLPWLLLLSGVLSLIAGACWRVMGDR